MIGCYQKKFPRSHIFSVENPISVYRGLPSVLTAEMLCVKELLYRKIDKWKIFMNLAGSELPLVSLKSLRQRLKNAGGNVVDVGFSNHFWRDKERQSVNER